MSERTPTEVNLKLKEYLMFSNKTLTDMEENHNIQFVLEKESGNERFGNIVYGFRA